MQDVARGVARRRIEFRLLTGPEKSEDAVIVAVGHYSDVRLAHRGVQRLASEAQVNPWTFVRSLTLRFCSGRSEPSRRLLGQAWRQCGNGHAHRERENECPD